MGTLKLLSDDPNSFILEKASPLDLIAKYQNIITKKELDSLGWPVSLRRWWWHSCLCGARGDGRPRVQRPRGGPGPGGPRGGGQIPHVWYFSAYFSFNFTCHNLISSLSRFEAWLDLTECLALYQRANHKSMWQCNSIWGLSPGSGVK